MQIHELTKPKKINEGLRDIFGLNNPTVKAAWEEIGGELAQNLAAKFTRDPRYTNLPLAQRKLAMMRDQTIQQAAEQKLEELTKYVAGIEIKSGKSLTDQQYQAALMPWIDISILNKKYAELDPAVKNTVLATAETMSKNRTNANIQKQLLTTLLADESARMVQVATDLQKFQAANAPAAPVKTQTAAATATTAAQPASTTTVSGVKAGTPTAAELAKFDQAVAQAIKAKI